MQQQNHGFRGFLFKLPSERVCMEDEAAEHVTAGMAFPRNLTVFSADPDAGERLVRSP